MNLTDKVLVTGAGGLIGSATVGLLWRQGIQVTGLYKGNTSESLKWPVLVGDLAGIPLGNIAGIDIPFKTIIHCAAHLPAGTDDLATAAQVNAKIDSNVVHYASAFGSRLIFISGTSVYGCSKDLCQEESPADPIGPYVLEKLKSEKEIQKVLSDYLILRVSAPYGPFQKSRTVLRIFVENALSNQTLYYYGSGKREQDFTFVDDVAECILQSLSHEQVNGVFNVASGNAISMRELGNLIVSLLPNCTSSVAPKGSEDLQEDCLARFSIEKAARLLNWKPTTPIKEGLKKMINPRQ